LRLALPHLGSSCVPVSDLQLDRVVRRSASSSLKNPVSTGVGLRLLTVRSLAHLSTRRRIIGQVSRCWEPQAGCNAGVASRSKVQQSHDDIWRLRSLNQDRDQLWQASRGWQAAEVRRNLIWRATTVLPAGQSGTLRCSRADFRS